MVSQSIERYRERIVSGPILSTMFKLGFPLMMTDVIMLIYNLTDAYWLSQFSSYALAVPRQTWPMFLVFNSIIIGIANANLAILSQYIGARMYDKVSETVSKFFTVCLTISTILFILYESLKYYMFAILMNVPREILADVLGYAEIIALDCISFGFSISISTLMQAFGDTHTPARVIGIGAILNAILDPVFILGFNTIPPMGARGAAIATVITRLFSGILLFYLFKKRYPEIRISFSKHIDKEWLSLSLRIGLPVTIMTIADGFAFTFQQALVNIFGVVATNAFAIGFIVLDIANAILRGFTMSISIMVGQNLGAGNTKRAREIALTAAHTIALIVFTGALIVFMFKDQLVSVFTNDVDIAFEAKKLVSIIAWILPLMMLSFLSMSVGRGSGHALFPTVNNIVRFWLIRIGLGYILAISFGMGVKGVLISITLSEVVGGIASYMWIRYGDWVKPIIKHRALLQTRST